MDCWDVILVFELWNFLKDFKLQGGGGPKFHSQRPRNPLTSLVGYMVKLEGEFSFYDLVI